MSVLTFALTQVIAAPAVPHVRQACTVSMARVQPVRKAIMSNAMGHAAPKTARARPGGMAVASRVAGGNAVP